MIVPRSQLASYAAHAIKDPAGPLASGGSFQVIPSGKRPFYCFIDLAVRSPGLMVTPAVLNVCAATGNKIVPAHGPAKGDYEPVQLGVVRALGVQTPLYRGGLVPRTAAGRRGAFIGWIGIALTPKVVMHAALAAHPDTALTLRYARGASPVACSAGKVLRGASSLTVDLHNGWTVRAAAVVAGSAVLSNGHALTVLLGGLALSVLVGLLGVVLSTGRTPALRLVSEQTIVLRDQAAELRVTVDELEAAQAIKDEFLALVSHELRTPLTSIRGYTELLRDEELADEQRDYVNVIDRNSARLVGLVEDLLLMAQIGGLHPVQFGSRAKPVTSLPSAGSLRDFITWPASARGIPLKLRVVVTIAGVKHTLSFAVTPRA